MLLFSVWHSCCYRVCLIVLFVLIFLWKRPHLIHPLAQISIHSFLFVFVHCYLSPAIITVSWLPSMLFIFERSWLHGDPPRKGRLPSEKRLLRSSIARHCEWLQEASLYIHGMTEFKPLVEKKKKKKSIYVPHKMISFCFLHAWLELMLLSLRKRLTNYYSLMNIILLCVVFNLSLFFNFQENIGTTRSSVIKRYDTRFNDSPGHVVWKSRKFWFNWWPGFSIIWSCAAIEL